MLQIWSPDIDSCFVIVTNENENEKENDAYDRYQVKKFSHGNQPLWMLILDIK